MFAYFPPIYIPIWLDLLLSIFTFKKSLFIKFTFQYGQIYYPAIALVSAVTISIYIPIWLDLLYSDYFKDIQVRNDLHSNMVRFIMIELIAYANNIFQFTFQYGQIYYLSNCQLFLVVYLYLHSNMVRFIIFFILYITNQKIKFTFQYGQIYYKSIHNLIFLEYRIYIPIWLDLLFEKNIANDKHFREFTFQYGQIYYFICKYTSKTKPIFTFQYGQIYYMPLINPQRLKLQNLHSNMVRFIIQIFIAGIQQWNIIYIPIWLDLLLIIPIAVYY